MRKTTKRVFLAILALCSQYFSRFDDKLPEYQSTSTIRHQKKNDKKYSEKHTNNETRSKEHKPEKVTALHNLQKENTTPMRQTLKHEIPKTATATPKRTQTLRTVNSKTQKRN